MAGPNVDARALNSSLHRLAEQQEDNDLLVSLRRVLDYSAQLFSVDGGGLMLADERGELHYIVASTGPSHVLEQVQIDTGQGPCVDAFVHDQINVSADLANDPRYPEVARLVVPHGIGAVLAVPIHLSDIPVGSLNLYVNQPYDFDESELDGLTRYASVVEAMMHAAVTASHAGELAGQLAYALDYRAPIERGVGYLMARDGLTQPDAFQMLRAATRATRRKIGDVATELLDTGRLPGEAA